MSTPIYVIATTDGGLLRMRQPDEKVDPVICFQTELAANNWIQEAKVFPGEFKVKQISEDHAATAGKMIGVDSGDVVFMMLKPKTEKNANGPG